MFRFSLHKLILIGFISFFVFSCGLKYVPIQTPIDRDKERKQVIIESLAADFTAQNLKYKSYGFGDSKVLKPTSFFTLDSLFEKKYKLEQQNIIDKKLEERIQMQKNICYSDTGSIYYVENHVFGIEKDSVFEAFNAEIYVNQQNKINTLKILESANVSKKLINFYAEYKFRKSFISPGYDADESEKAFYDFYDFQLQTLVGKEQEEFLNFMLSMMKVANKIGSLDKSDLIKEYVRLYVQGNSKNLLNEKFEKIEEVSDDKNNLSYYYILYEYSSRNSKNGLLLNKVEVFLDPYLKLIEVKK